MPTLHWIGKEKVINHHHDVPFRLLKKQYAFQAKEGTPENSTGNRIIHGDNLEALKSLLPEFEGRINCIYIDPPYNTGNEGWVYNDNVNDPKIKKWLGEVVGKEGEDLSRHDKWLCMMYPRLKLLHRLLAEDGVIFISIDDNEQNYLHTLCDEIFGRGNFIATILWQKRTSPDARVNLGDAHEYVIVFSKKNFSLKLNKLEFTDKQKKNYSNPDNDPRGEWASTDFTAQGYRPNQMYEITTPKGRKITPPNNRCWKNIESVFLQLVKDNRIWFGKDGDGIPRRKTFLTESDGISSWTWWPNDEVGHSQEAKQEINYIFNNNSEAFETPKPVRLIDRMLRIATSKNSIILDSFAGSGTTAHAVLKLNAEDGGNRRFICVEMMDYAETITAERVRRVMNGYGEGTKAVGGLGGGFDYYTVDVPLFIDGHNLNEEVGAEAIRHYVAYTEGIPSQAQLTQDNTISPYALGVHNDALYAFYYERERITTLGVEFLNTLNLTELKPRPSGYIVYADKCAVDDEFLLQHGIVFKRIPRDISRL